MRDLKFGKQKVRKKIPRTGCWFCGGEMSWGADFSFEDYGMEGDGIVATLTCRKCNATAEFYTAVEEKE